MVGGGQSRLLARLLIRPEAPKETPAQGSDYRRIIIVGADRITAQGDVCNKIGTYLKALAAHDNRVPFYVALPHSTIDWNVNDGVAEIPIEERGGDACRVVGLRVRLNPH